MDSLLSGRTAVIVVAAGSGTRLGAGMPKALVSLSGRSLLERALDAVARFEPRQVILVAPSGAEQSVSDAAAALPDTTLVTIVTGGETRQLSVAAGLAALTDGVDIVLVHDAARVLTPVDVFERVAVAVASGSKAVIPVLPVIDTIKRVDSDRVVDTVDRSRLAAAQTPQGFDRAALVAAADHASADVTDDAEAMARAGHPVHTVAGDERAFKVTTPADLERLRGLVAPPTGAIRVGVGTDVHAFGGAGELWLAGISWPGEPALSGHSDGDAVAHAIVDALLSAAGLGDIGVRFGTDRPEFAGAHADAFLAETMRMIQNAGWSIGNVSVQVQAARPKLSPRRAEAEAALSAALGGAPVALSATTTDGLGFTGRAEGVQAIATALLIARY